LDVLGWLKKYEVEGVVISGGEPTTRSDLLDILAEAKKQDFEMVLSTNGKREEMILQTADYVDWIALPIDTLNIEPDKEIYDLAFSKLQNILPQEILFIDDKEKSLIPAREAGWNAILFDSYEQLIKDLKNLSIDIT